MDEKKIKEQLKKINERIEMLGPKDVSANDVSGNEAYEYGYRAGFKAALEWVLSLKKETADKTPKRKKSWGSKK